MAEGRHEHTFQFPANIIAEAARAETDYHAARLDHWQFRFDHALDRVEATIGAKVERVPVTGGMRMRVAVNYGDPDAHAELQLSERKIEYHKDRLEVFQSEANVYGSQGERIYDLTNEDVRHFRLGGEPRSDDETDSDELEY